MTSRWRPAAEPRDNAGMTDARPGRRSSLRRLSIAAAAVLVLVAALSAGAAWYVSGRIHASFQVPQPTRPDDLEILAVEGDRIRYRDTKPDAGPPDDGRIALKLANGGWVYTGSETQTQDGAVTRTIEKIDGAPPQAGEWARLDVPYYRENPKVGLDLDYEQVTFPGPLGDYPAWYVPGPRATWLVYTHGRGSPLREGLRVMEIAHRAGHPALLIGYRNDEGAPRGDGVAKFGADEWQDLEAAIAYAKTRGAADVILGGGSMGGAITMSLFEHGSPHARSVRGVFLDSPALDVGRQSRLGAMAMGLPGPLAELGLLVAAWRFGLDWEAMDYLSAVDDITVPVLVLHGDADRTITVEANRPIYDAMARLGNYTVAIIPGATHLGVWNHDRADFERRVAQFLTTVGGAAP